MYTYFKTESTMHMMPVALAPGDDERRKESLAPAGPRSSYCGMHSAVPNYSGIYARFKSELIRNSLPPLSS